MSDELEPIDDPTADEIAAVEALLARADADQTLWVDSPAGTEAAILAAIADEQGLDPAGSVTDLSTLRSGRFTVTSWLAAAAAIIVVVAGVTLIVRGGDDADVFALEGTDRAPDASAEVEVSETPIGLKFLLKPDRLPAAPEGTYYEFWLSDGDVKVSAGTFHMRGGSGQIELWAGVVDPRFTRLAVTLEPIDTDLDSSGDAYLRGTLQLDD